MAGHQTGTVRMACTGAAAVDIAELSGFQGTLKTLTPTNAAKLRAQIVDTGFSEPISIWQHGGKNLVLNGHQRLTVLAGLRDEGWNVPPVPVSLVEAADEDEARRKVLAFASQYGSVTSEGLAAFLDTTELALPDLEGFVFPEIPVFVPPEDKDAPAEFKIVGDDIEVAYCCPKCSYEWSGKPR